MLLQGVGELGVPLDAQDELMPEVMIGHRLDKTVLRTDRLHLEILPQFPDALVMDGIHATIHLPCNRIELGQEPVRREMNAMMNLIVKGRVAVALLGPELGDKILVERPAEIDVDELATAADAQDGLAVVDRELEDLQLVMIPVRIAGPLVPVQVGVAVGLRGDIDPALQDESVHVLEEVLETFGLQVGDQDRNRVRSGQIAGQVVLETGGRLMAEKGPLGVGINEISGNSNFDLLGHRAAR